MHQITVKYSSDCRKCGLPLNVEETAIHEKHVGLFCVDCAPTDPEEIRAYRQEAGDRRAEKYEEWAEKRENRANRQLNSNPEVRHDWAFVTQPGHIPFRARMLKADERAFKSLEVAEGFRGKAESLHHVRVAGDAERKRQAKRDAIKPLLAVGMKVLTPIFGGGIIRKVNQKSVSV